VYYVKHISKELWMAKEATTLNGGLESRTVEGMMIKRIQKQCK